MDVRAEMTVGEADVERAEEPQAAWVEERKLLAMARRTLPEMKEYFSKMEGGELCLFHRWLEEETRLDDSCDHFAGIVLGLSGGEMIARFMKREEGVGGGEAR